ncbi:MAG: type II 3-dehydroquinate dehydratase [Clostridia bacterium]|nr:type II 3-dehydroquinate dehydratase [Clostridia bacterium]
MKILVINGPNINMQGIREKDIYGEGTYQSLIEFIKNVCDQNDIDVDFFQSNHEGAIIDEIQRAYGKYDGIVINPAAYTHTSVAILDALKAVDIKTVEVHLSNIYEREEFRHNSFVSAACVKTYMGKGFEGYKEAIIFLKNM